MLSIDFIRNNKQKVIDAAKNKNCEVDVEKILSLDHQRRTLIQEIQKLREERNTSSKQQPTEEVIKRGKEIKEKLKELETKLTTEEELLNQALNKVPNIPSDHVQPGDESSNKVLRKEGEPNKFDFIPKDHVELGEILDIIDIPRAAKVSGTRFAYLKNEGVLLELALVQYAMKKLRSEGFSLIIPPTLIKKNITTGLGYWEAGNNENYYLVYDPERNEKGEETPNELYLIGTGEHAVVPYYMNEIIEEKDLPKRFAAFSPCYRREAGSYGKDTRGILRVHQFDKVEMVSIVRTKEEDEQEFKKIQSLAESFLKDLKLPYQVVQLSIGDLSFPAAETIDLETWIPSQNKYRETHSISTTTDFQSRRLKIKYRISNAGQLGESFKLDQSILGGTEYVRILNGTALAIGRTIVAILENNQQADGSVKIPEVLQKYTGFDEIKRK